MTTYEARAPLTRPVLDAAPGEWVAAALLLLVDRYGPQRLGADELDRALAPRREGTADLALAWLPAEAGWEVVAFRPGGPVGAAAAPVGREDGR